MHNIAQLSDLNTVIGKLISSLIGLGAAVFAIMLVFNGFAFLQAGSNKDANARAKAGLSVALIGLIIVVSAWMIIAIAQRFLGVTLTTFDICLPGGC